MASKLAYHDVDLTAFGYDYGQCLRSHSTLKVTYLCRDFEKVLAQASIDSKIGLIATGDSFIAGQDKIDDIKGTFQKSSRGNGRSSHCSAAHSVKKSFIVVRAMSDTAARR
ncbi:MAG: hypothetical protein ACLS36_09625 [Streptococcus sp.]